ISFRFSKFFAVLGHLAEASGNVIIYGSLRIGSVFAGLSHLFPGQQLHTFIDGFDRVNMELSLTYRFNNVAAKHQIFLISFWNEHALLSRESFCFTDIEKTFNLFIDAANGLYFSMLVDRARDAE